MMKTVWGIVASVLILSGSHAVAQTKANMAQVSCSDLSQMYVEEYVVIGAWMSGYYNAKRNNTVIDVKQLTENSRKAAEFCKSHPKMTVMKAIEQVLKAKN